MRRRPLAFGKRRRINQFDDMLPDQWQIRQCGGKRMMNKQQAVQTVAWMKKHRDATGRLEYYRCRVCSRWHVGNNRKDAA